MRAAVCLILGVLVGVGCGSDSPDPAALTAGTGALQEAGAGGGGTAGMMAVGMGAGTTASPANAAGAGAGGSGGTGGGSAAAGTAGPRAGTGGAPAAGRSGSPAGTGGGAGAPAAGSGGAGGSAPVPTEKFSFFVTSLGGMRELSKNEQGFGGDLRYGQATGLAGADKICTDLAEKSMPGAGAKGWRAFLSTAKGGSNDGPVHAKDRIGEGPWYDRNGRLVAMTLTALLNTRPMGADAAIINDLPNEEGVPNHQDTMPGADDNHDVVTGTNMQGMYDGTPTCEDWTSTGGAAGTGGGTMGGGRGGSRGPRIGHSWPAQSGMSWTTAHQAPGCAPSVSLVQMGGGSGTGIGNGGGYGGIYCFALKP